jgi:predicted Rossmann fold flavoprotein
MVYDVIVVGGGASGLMAAGRAAERGRSVLLIEKNKRLGTKLSISGGGRCNITNAEHDVRALLAHYGSAAEFLYSSFAQFGVQESFDFFESRGVRLKVEARKRAFPVSERAEDVVDALHAYCAKAGTEIRLGTAVQGIQNTKRGFEVHTEHETFLCHSLVLATGGVSHPETGSTGDGFGWLTALGHTVAKPTPTIVPLKTADRWIHELKGVTLPNAKCTFYAEGRKAHTVRGDILCTHFGLSGPTILNSAHRVDDLLYEGVVTARIDLFPDLDLGALDARMLALFDEHKNKTLKNALKELLPDGVSRGILLLTDIDPEYKVHSLPREERKRLGALLKALPVTVLGLMGFDRAVIADGGVPLSEVDTRTFESRVIKNLYITGDLLHINRPSGGYSLQLCWTSGYVAGGSV